MDGAEERRDGSRAGDRRSKAPPCRRKRDKSGAPSGMRCEKGWASPRSAVAAAILRLQCLERGQAGREVTLYPPKSGEARSGGESGGLGVEQFSSLSLRCGRSGGN